ncbi:hypothetical protein K474DRAFT_1655880 [Panus rudis PR-1116 ss-1]|nr:hypothetical protein K474DRAFT_1655880 [Panus rudis PR-1116 ss-1]
MSLLSAARRTLPQTHARLRIPTQSSLRQLNANSSTQARFASSSSRPLTSSPLKTAAYTTLLALSTGLFLVYYYDSRSAIHRYVITPLLRYTLDPEKSHRLAVRVLESGLAPRDTQPDDEVLRVELWGQQLSNPVGLAAGFDKDGEAIDGLFDLGFSWVEIGSVTPHPQSGNPKPRVFRLETDHAIVNRYGFPSDGHSLVISRLRDRIHPLLQEQFDAGVGPASLREGKLLAVNLGKNKTSAPDSVSDFVAGVRKFVGLADVLVVNVSSPNTPGLRGLQTRSLLQELLSSVTEARDETVSLQQTARKPRIILKIAPDLTESDVVDIAEAVRSSGVDGVIVSNTTIQRPSSLRDMNKEETGGLSGPPLKPLTLKTLKTLRSNLPASIPIIGCGGIASGQDALDYARAGASYVQLYTEMTYDGVGVARRIKDELTEALKKEGTTWSEVVRKSVAGTSLKESTSHAKGSSVENLKGETSVQTLIEEAKELKRLIDTFATSFKQSIDEAAPAAAAGESTTPA